MRADDINEAIYFIAQNKRRLCVNTDITDYLLNHCWQH